ncbi:Rho guanine nucleotide exchange factor 7, variant 2 [Chamberlinius hualienensis]
MAADAVPVNVKALYEFRGANNDELNFDKGDIITITQMPEGGWWEGTLNGITGWFPSNYVKENKDESSFGEKVTNSQQVNTRDLLNIRQETIKTYRNVVLNDIIDSERNHLNELQNLQKSYLVPLQLSDTLSVSEFSALVGNLDEIVEIHKLFLSALEKCVDVSPRQQKIGGVFMNLAPVIKGAHLMYSSNHPKAAKIMEKSKNELSGFLEGLGVAVPGIRLLTTGLSRPFRRLEKYRGLLLELEHHVEESHPDRGDTQRAAHVYNDISEACSKARRQREMELEILQNNIRCWEGEEPEKLGDIILMGQVTVITEANDRQLRHAILFPTTLVFLSVSSRMSAFVYEGKLPLTGVNISRVNDSENYRYAFEITGNMIDRIVVVCQNLEELNQWLEVIKQQINFSCSASSTTAIDISSFNNYMIPSSSVLGKLTDAKSSTSTVKVPYRSSDQVWRSTSLRPAPPLRPCWIVGGSNDDSGVTRRTTNSRGIKAKNEQSFAGDNRILQVIEAYCTSSKTRNTVNSTSADDVELTTFTCSSCAQCFDGDGDRARALSNWCCHPSVVKTLWKSL